MHSQHFGNLDGRIPYATAQVHGSEQYPNIYGTVNFYSTPAGSIVEANVQGLPAMTLPTATPQAGPFGFHVHEGVACGQSTGPNPFSAAGGHYNPTNQPHPLHAGDLPVLFPNNGISYMSVYTDRFQPSDVVGRTIVIHQMPDDFRTQPAGDSGMRIGCGMIQKN